MIPRNDDIWDGPSAIEDGAISGHRSTPRRLLPRWRWLARFLGASLMLGPGAALAAGPAYSEQELIDGFNRAVFGREDDASGADSDFVSKFVGPVRIAVVNAEARGDRSPAVRRFVRMLDRQIPGLDLRLVDRTKQAALIVYLVERDSYAALVTAVARNTDKSRFLRENRCTALMWTRTTGLLVRAAVFIVVDEGERHFQSCLAEELTQALGPANDSDRLVHSLYNDHNNVGQFGLFDWFIVAALYDARILPGMSRAEANAALPSIIRGLRGQVPRGLLPAR